MSKERKKPGVVFWGTVTLMMGTPILYVLSFGVYARLCVKGEIPDFLFPTVTAFYWPLYRAFDLSDLFRSLMSTYVDLWLA